MSVKRKHEESDNYEEDWRNVKIRKYAEVHVRYSITQEKVLNRLKRAWNNGHDRELDDDYKVEVWTEPFKICVAQDFMFDDDFLEDLAQELFELDLVKKSNDLYQFHQSVNLTTVEFPQVELLIEFLNGKCRQWIENITGIQLNNKLSVTFSRYDHTDHLLCHDDKCEDRKIAFIIYFNHTWSQSDGGGLELFDCDDTSQPREVVRSIYPAYNKFVFFEVTDASYHQVSEIICADKTRLTVSGWFHADGTVNKPVPFIEPAAARFCPHHQQDKTALAQFINPSYLASQQQSQIFDDFVARSEILLVDFLDESWYRRISSTLRNENTKWITRGPANRRCYDVIVPETVGPDLAALIAVMKSHVMFDLLQKMTNLDLATLVAGKRTKRNPQCSYEIQRWKAGSYTLLDDSDPTFSEFGLDAIIYFNHEDLLEQHGGYTTFIARGADDELLTVIPCKNALALTYRDKDTMRFVKYINSKFRGTFHTITFTYYE